MHGGYGLAESDHGQPGKEDGSNAEKETRNTDIRMKEALWAG